MALAVEPIPLGRLEPGDELLQSGLWAELKRQFGWEPHGFRIEGAQGEGSEDRYTLLALARGTPLGRLLYVPYGVPPATPLRPLTRELSATAAATTVRFDLSWDAATTVDGARRAVADVQPSTTVVVGLDGDDDALLAAMKSKTRYNVRLAERRGVSTRVYPAAEALQGPLDAWTGMHADTARRHGITAHSAAYFRTLFQLAASADAAATPSGDADLFLIEAWGEGELLAGIVVSVCGRQARYLYGASSERQRSSMPNYALQWAAMRLAKQRGCSSYDLFGIPPTADPSHPWHGLYRLKTGFGGEVVQRAGCWDVPGGSWGFRMMRAAERTRSWYFHALRPRLARAPATPAEGS